MTTSWLRSFKALLHRRRISFEKRVAKDDYENELNAIIMEAIRELEENEPDKE